MIMFLKKILLNFMNEKKDRFQKELDAITVEFGLKNFDFRNINSKKLTMDYNNGFLKGTDEEGTTYILNYIHEDR
jgi:hypothetical protein